jgi:hypothetical protein
MDNYFSFNSRIQISVPSLQKKWDDYSIKEQELIVFEWEKIRGSIPDKIKYFESMINKKQEQLNNEADFDKSCALNQEISEFASKINDLWIWYRLEQFIDKSKSLP